jgi:hypothetical protein
MQNTIPSIVLISVLTAVFLVAAASCEVSIGVQSGDWIEYSITSSGAPMQGHDVEAARMEIVAVEGSNVTVKITSNFTDGTSDTITSTLNFETGHLIDDFIIPAGLEVGESFPDENYGTINITGSEVRTYAGAQRTVLNANIGSNTYVWDQETGVSVEGFTETADYSIHSVVFATNMWQPNAAPSRDVVSITLAIASVLIIAALILVGVARYRHRKPPNRAKPVESSCCC